MRGKCSICLREMDIHLKHGSKMLCSHCATTLSGQMICLGEAATKCRDEITKIFKPIVRRIMR